MRLPTVLPSGFKNKTPDIPIEMPGQQLYTVVLAVDETAPKGQHPINLYAETAGSGPTDASGVLYVTVA